MAGRVVVVTGAGSGIGQATAERFASDGDVVACLDVDPAAAGRVAAGLGGRSSAHEVDVRDEAGIDRAVTDVIERHGRLDVVVNAAGVGGFAHTTEVTLEEWERVVGINLTGTFLVCRRTLPALEASGGCVVNIASVAGLSGRAYGAAYSASKGGVVMLTRSLALEYGRRGVRVNAVCPGAVDTPLLERFGRPEGADDGVLSRGGLLGRLATPEEIASAIGYLASDAAAYVTGTSMVVDAGATA